MVWMTVDSPTHPKRKWPVWGGVYGTYKNLSLDRKRGGTQEKEEEEEIKRKDKRGTDKSM